MTPQASSTNRPPAPSILIVDDEPVIRNAFQIYFETVGYDVSVAERGDDALKCLRRRQGNLDVVLLDLAMPGMHGIDVLREIKAIDNSVEVIIATGCGGMNTAIEAMRQGAFDYVTKPVVNLDQDLLTVVEGALERRARGRGPEDPAGPRVQPTTDARVVSYYVALEILAREAAAAADRAGAVDRVATFALRHLKALAVYEVAAPAGGNPAIVASWGDLATALDPARAPWQPLDLAAILTRPREWQRTGVRAEAGGAGVPLELEVLSTGCCCAAAHPGSPCDRSPALVVVRRTQGWRSVVTPDGALLGLVAERALTR